MGGRCWQIINISTALVKSTSTSEISVTDTATYCDKPNILTSLFMNDLNNERSHSSQNSVDR